MFTGLPLYLGIAALVVIVALSGTVWLQTERLDTAKGMIAALELANHSYDVELQRARESLATCLEVNNANKEELEGLREWARIAEERQREIDRLAAERARALQELAEIAEAYRVLRATAAPLSVCQSYEMVLSHIAGGSP
ncbi:MAG: hypothetical protein AMJ65_09720 [Phycisphaerae bacterium SG8_4]|nr:MAG: hypothetical protein AMJ65_09720 [Phycisphaerae bacterium SG8_4]